MRQDAAETLDEAFARLHRTGPEFQGYLSNHGPMVVESLVHCGQWEAVPAWLDLYTPRLIAAPRPTERITANGWRDALGDRARAGDWIAFFAEELRERPWRDTLARWWPELLPGLPGAATHGVIRVGHAVRALRTAGESPTRLAEFAHAMAYFATAYLALPDLPPLAGGRTPSDGLPDVPPIPVEERDHVTHRLDLLAAWPAWLASTLAVRPAETPERAETLLADTVRAATRAYVRRGHGDGVMTVHAATAPNAVLRVLPDLPRSLWAASYATAWATSSAIASVYAARADADDVPPAPADPTEAMTRALAHGDEHAIKLADTAADVWARSADPLALSATTRATRLLIPLGN